MFYPSLFHLEMFIVSNDVALISIHFKKERQIPAVSCTKKFVEVVWEQQRCHSERRNRETQRKTGKEIDKAGEMKINRVRNGVRAPTWTWWVGHAHSVKHNQCAPPKMMFSESQHRVHIFTHKYTHTKWQHTHTHTSKASLKRTLLCECPAGRETGRHRTHHYY